MLNQRVNPITSGNLGMLTMVLVDDDALVLQALRLLLSDDDISIMEACRTVDSGKEAILRHRPHVAIIDLAFYGDLTAGIRLVQAITDEQPNVRCMILTALEPSGAMLRDAVQAGAKGFWRKSTMGGDGFLAKVRHLAAGECVIEDDLIDPILAAITNHSDGARHLSHHTPDVRPVVLPELSRREREILRLINRNDSIKEIATKLFVEETTVKTHLKNSREKLGFDMNSHQAAIYALLHGLLSD